MIKSSYEEIIYYNKNFTGSIHEIDEQFRLLLSENHGVGIIGGYYEQGLPICIVSELTVQLLGYDTIEEFKAGTDGLLTSLILKGGCSEEEFSKPEDTFSFHLRARHGIVWVRMVKRTFTGKNGTPMWIASVCNMDDLYRKELVYDRVVTEKQQEEEKYQEELENAYRKLEKQTVMLEKTLEDVNLNSEIISAISKIYWLIYCLDLPSGIFDEISSDGITHRFTGDHGKISERFPEACRKTVAPKYQETMLKFLDMSTLSERLRDHDDISQEYMTKTGNWHIGSFIVQSRDADGNVIKALYAIRIINEQKKQELAYQQKLLNIAAEAERASIAKTDFLRRMSHDIRTPINAIRGMIEIENYYPQNYEKLRECREKIYNASGFLLELVNNVLDMNKLESGQVKLEHKPFDLVNTLDGVNSILDIDGKEHGIDFIVGRGVVTHRYLIGSPLHFQQILQNIGGNAIKYNRLGGKVVLTCDEISFDGKTAMYEITCTDNGRGMSKEFQKHAFEPFSQENTSVRTSYSGTGLGLAIVKELVELMGGSIALESELDKGSKFTVKIPFEVEVNHKFLATNRAEKNISLEGRKVLLVEDNELNMEIAEFMLQQEKMIVTKAMNGYMAVEMFRNSAPNEFDYILMDIMMPKMNGTDAAKIIRSMERSDAKTVPIFAMTANAFMDDVEKSKSAGINEHFSKPLDFRALIRTFQKYAK